jgi:putative tricarboxylic transport membrane protein
MIAYQQAKFLSKTPEQFGNGSIEGIAANESAQNAANSGELVPTLGLGIAGSGSMVLLLSALTVQGLVPGPRMIVETPELVYASVAGMVAATILLIITGWWLARVMLKAVTINRSAVIVVALALVVVGVYSLNGKVFDVMVCLVCGFIGYFMLRYGYSTAAAALAVVLSEGFEKHLRQGLALFDSNVWTFVSRPITAALLLLSLAIFVYGVIADRKTRALARARIAAGALSADAEKHDETHAR